MSSNRLRPLFLVLLIAASPAPAEPDSGPAAVVRTGLAEIEATYQETGGATRAGFPGEVMEKIIFPRVDFRMMLRLAIGGGPWASASETERVELERRFKARLTRIFSELIAAYDGQPIEVLAGTVRTDTGVASVETLIHRSGGPPFRVVYDLRLGETDGWRVYDVSIDDVSVVTCYRADFAAEAEQAGVCGVIESLGEPGGG